VDAIKLVSGMFDIWTAAISSAFSVLISTAGLVLLSVTRPRDMDWSAWTGGRVYLYKAAGVFGAFLHFLGLALSSMPWLLGVWLDEQGKAAMMLQCTLVLACWAADRFLADGRPPSPLLSCGCVVVWFGSTLVEWAGPRPYDSLMPGLSAQIAGCDGGYRSPFLIYAPLWLTVIIFGTLFLLVTACEDLMNASIDSESDIGDGSASSVSFKPSSRPSSSMRSLRRKLLPIIHGFALSMAGVCFGSGAARAMMSSVSFASVLLVIAVVCAWQWLWSLERSLGEWAMLSQNTAVLLRLVQAHLVFRDFRWSPQTETGLLIMWKWPGVWFFLLGFFLVVAVTVLFLAAPDGEPEGRELALSASSSATSLSTDKSLHLRGGAGIFPVALCQWLMFLVCLVSFYFGITQTILDFKYRLPEVQFVQGNSTGPMQQSAAPDPLQERTASGQSYLQLITTLYDKRLPCSAMVMAFNTVGRAPLQFGTFIAVKLRPAFLPPALLRNLQQTYVVDQAQGWFVNIFVLMLLAAFFNLTGPSGAVEFTTYLGDGFWYFLLFAFSGLLVAQSFQLFPETGAARHAGIPRRMLKSNDSENGSNGHRRDANNDSDTSSDAGGSDDEGGSQPVLMAVGLVVLLLAILASMVLGLTMPFLDFDYRVSGVLLKQASPTLLELLGSIGTMYPGLGLLTVLTLLGTMVLWLPVFVLRMLKGARELGGGYSRFLELAIRPWIMIDLWAVSVLVIYYIVTARNKATIEVCAHFPEDPAGILAICALFLAGKAAVQLAKCMLEGPADAPGPTAKPVRLPCGNATWGAAAGATFVFWLLFLYFHGPPVTPQITSLHDFNHVLSVLLANANTKLQQKLPHSAGDCDALWQHRVATGKELYGDTDAESDFHKTCRGNKPLARVHKKVMNAEASWATGLSSLQLVDVHVMPPRNISAPSQRWTMALNGHFTDLHLWLKVKLGDKPWLDDYMCCHNPFHFSLLASATCTVGRGFEGVALEVSHIDAVEFEHEVNINSDPDTRSSYEVNYGSYDAVAKALSDFLSMKSAHLFVKNADGTATDALVAAGNVMADMFRLNTGNHCPHHY